MYNEHKKVHPIKFQSVVAPNSLVVNLYAPVEGKHHDRGMLVKFHLLDVLQRYYVCLYGHTSCIYGHAALDPLDLAFRHHFHDVLTPDQQA